jgi:HrpA-like RNA helicase
VIDCGFSKEMRYDAKRNMAILETVQSCRSSADQRKGRAGRTAPGVCYRLYDNNDYLAMRLSQLPEVLRSPLHLTLLSLIRMNINPRDFNWIEQPDPLAVADAVQDLCFLDAITDVVPHKITEFGHMCSELQMDPMLLRVVWQGALNGMARTATVLGGLLTVSSNFFYRGGDEEAKMASDEKKVG